MSDSIFQVWTFQLPLAFYDYINNTLIEKSSSLVIALAFLGYCKIPLSVCINESHS
jgi:hypothetical protein